MKSYVDSNYYESIFEGNTLKDENINKYLKSASADVDTLTFSRIIGIGFDNLTQFQQEKIKDVVCMLADFKFSNKDILETVLSNYSINRG